MIRALYVALCVSMMTLIGTAPLKAAKRAAIIGFSGYSWAPLPGVKSDMKLINELLKADYIITTIDDASKSRTLFRDKWDPFVDSIQDQDQVLVYYSGHAIDVNGANYLLPLDAQAPNGQKKLSTLSEDFILLRNLVEEVQEKTPQLAVFLIDACRTNPYKGAVKGPATDAGLAREVLQPYNGYTVIFFSADFNQPAFDSIPGKSPSGGSPFSHAFSQLYPQAKAQPLLLMFQRVSYTVQAMVAPNSQVPAFQGMVPPSLCLGACDQKLMQILFNSVEGKRVVVDSQPSTTAAPSPSPSSPPTNTVENLKALGNVVFVGKASQIKCLGNESSVDNPFGCEFLKKAISVASGDGKTTAKDIAHTVAQVDVFMRRSAPRVSGAVANYDCPVGVVKKGASVRFKGVASYQYVGDTFLWGIVDAPSLKECSRP
ncbi:Caspase domain-containing protein [Bradyrhizobium sp. NFR13]|uniref:caspase family protein n=1 Tax=Bradyrhizobium sp. NFR13 TaxID=1566285 RepID=UPI0008EE94D8|nr:caspase family protein [Bradyrhizobium sp. NFR13]SFL50894.1 Caspase domain-containing protein [Bradyrhizobium sp. NFR13]